MPEEWWKKPGSEQKAPLDRDWINTRRHLSRGTGTNHLPAAFLPRWIEFYPPPDGTPGPYPSRPSWPPATE